MTDGYSETPREPPLVQKLNLRDGQLCWFDNMPENIIDEIDEYALELRFLRDLSRIRLGGLNAAHIFVTDEADLTDKLADLRVKISKNGQVWVSWPKQGSGHETALDQNIIQSIGIGAGFINTKECAIDDIWLGMKFVIPKTDR